MPLPRNVHPIRLLRCPAPFNHPDWIFEILCGGPHNNSLWRSLLCGAGMRGQQWRHTEPAPTLHNSIMWSFRVGRAAMPSARSDWSRRSNKVSDKELYMGDVTPIRKPEIIGEAG